MINNLLIVEDDEFKMQSLHSWTTSFYPQCIVSKTVSVSTTVHCLNDNIYDVIFLDMALPARELKQGSGPTESLLSGGLEILLELAYRDRTDKVVIVTQYPEIEIDGRLVELRNAADALREAYYLNILDCIHYEHSIMDWQQRLSEALK